MRPISGKRPRRILERRGWVLVDTSGSHHKFRSPDGTRTTIIPIHGNHDLKPGTQRSIMKDAGLDEGDL